MSDKVHSIVAKVFSIPISDMNSNLFQDPATNLT